jgi:hypothetical protein
METKTKAKKPKEFEKIKGTDNLFISYIHNFTGYKKLLAALHHLQKAENLYVSSKITIGFKFEKIEDSNILEYLGSIFNAVVCPDDDSSFATPQPKADEGVICRIYFMNNYKTKTYIFQHSADFYKGWLSDKLPIIIGRNRNEGMTRLRFLSLRVDTKNELEKILDLKAICHCIQEVYDDHDAYVNSIEMVL